RAGPRVRAGRGERGFRIAGAVEAPGHPGLGQDAGAVADGRPAGLPIQEDLAAIVRRAHVVVDFTGAPDARPWSAAPRWWSAPRASTRGSGRSSVRSPPGRAPWSPPTSASG